MQKTLDEREGSKKETPYSHGSSVEDQNGELDRLFNQIRQVEFQSLIRNLAQSSRSELEFFLEFRHSNFSPEFTTILKAAGWSGMWFRCVVATHYDETLEILRNTE